MKYLYMTKILIKNYLVHFKSLMFHFEMAQQIFEHIKW